MIKGTFILIWSENPDELMKFYKDILGLEFTEKTDIPAINELGPDYGYEFKIGDKAMLWIGKHDGIKGKNKEPLRIMHNLYVDSVSKWHKKLIDAGVEIIQEPALAPFSTDEKQTYVNTFLDPDGNCFQFMGGK